MSHFLFKIQIAILIQQELTPEILERLTSKLREIFNPDTLPLSVPVDKNAPDDVPRMIFQSENNEILQIKKRRIDFIHSIDESNNNKKMIDQIEDITQDLDRLKKTLLLLTENSIPYVKCGVIFEVLKEDTNPNRIFNLIQFEPFFTKNNEKIQDLSFNVGKQTKKEFDEYGLLLQNFYINSGLRDDITKTKYYLFGLDMNNFDSSQNISTQEKVFNFIKFVFSELKSKVGVLPNN